MDEKRTKKSRKKGRRSHLWLAAAIVLGVLAFGGCAAAHRLPAAIQARMDILPDPGAKQGVLNSGPPQEVGEGDFLVVLNQLPTMEEGSRECSIEYENPAENHYSARISLYLKEDGKLLGNTKRMDPGNYIETVQLKRELKPGEYPITVRVELFEEKTPVSELSIEITLRVVSQSGFKMT